MCDGCSEVGAQIAGAGAAILLDAARSIRADQGVCEQLGRIDAREYATWLAVADWLESAHANVSTYSAMTTHRHAFNVARAYLGGAA